MTTTELKRLTRKWQERLRLLDWNVHVRFAKKDEHEDVWGLCDHEGTTKEATIIIQNPRWATCAEDDYVRDQEVVICHELMHLHFAPLAHPANSLKSTVEEVIVCHVAQLLVALDRRDETLLNPKKKRTLSRVARIL